MSIFLFCISVVLLTIFIFRLLKSAPFYVPFISAILINIAWQIGSYLYIGYLDPFWKIAIAVGMVLAIFISGVTVLILRFIKN